MPYKAIVCRIHTFDHPNADRLKLGNAHGYQVVVGFDTNDGDLGVYFPSDGQLSEEFAIANDLVNYTDDQGNKKGGYFCKRRRVRAQNFRKEKSEGFWCALAYFGFTGYDIDKLKEGDQFDELNGVPICNKYYTPATRNKMKGTKGKKKRSNNMFTKHCDTKQLKHDIDNINPGSLIYFSEKLHGTSGRSAFVLDNKELRLPWYKRLLNYSINKPGTLKWREWSFLIGTRNVILRDENQKTFYNNEAFRYNVARPLEKHLYKGELVFYEIVGYTTDGATIMPRVNTSILKDKKIEKMYGKEMVYKYGCIEGQCDIYVYRICMINEDGILIDLPRDRVKHRCDMLCVKYVPEFGDMVVYNGDKDSLLETVSKYVDGPSTIDGSHMKEGVALRVEDGRGVHFYKSKGHNFGVLEGYIKEQDDYVDLEEVS